MKQVVYEYRDEMSRGQWRRSAVQGLTLEETIRFFGLGTDCEYRIVSVDGEEYSGRRGAAEGGE